MTKATVEEKKVPVEKKEEKVLDLNDISQLGYLNKSKEILKGVTVSLQTLSAARQQKVLSLMPADETDAIAKFTQLQIETLAHATVSINGKTYTKEEEVDTLREWYGTLQGRVLQEFYSFYSELLEEQDKVLIGLKKN